MLMGCPALQEIADDLNDEDNDQDQDGGDKDDIILEAVIADGDGHFPESASADGSGHGGQAKNGDQGQGGDTDQGRGGFRQPDLPDDFQRPQAHGPGGFDDSRIDGCHGRFDLTGEKGSGSHDQRDDGGFGADGGAHNDPGHRRDDGQHDDEGDGPADVDDFIQDAVHPPVGQQTVLPGQYQDNSQDEPEDPGDQAGPEQHVERGSGFGDELLLLPDDICKIHFV